MKKTNRLRKLLDYFFNVLCRQLPLSQAEIGIRWIRSSSLVLTCWWLKGSLETYLESPQWQKAASALKCKVLPFNSIFQGAPSNRASPGFVYYHSLKFRRDPLKYQCHTQGCLSCLYRGRTFGKNLHVLLLWFWDLLTRSIVLSFFYPTSWGSLVIGIAQ
jgi:hypothetical protein